MSILHVQDSRSQQLVKMVPLQFVGQTNLVQVVSVVQLLLWVVQAVSYCQPLEGHRRCPVMFLGVHLVNIPSQGGHVLASVRLARDKEVVRAQLGKDLVELGEDLVKNAGDLTFVPGNGVLRAVRAEAKPLKEKAKPS